MKEFQILPPSYLSYLGNKTIQIREAKGAAKAAGFSRSSLTWGKCPMVPRQSLLQQETIWNKVSLTACLQVSGFSSSWWVSSSKYSSSKRWCYWSVANVPFDMLKPAVQCLNQLVVQSHQSRKNHVHCYQLSPKKQVWEQQLPKSLRLWNHQTSLDEEFIVPSPATIRQVLQEVKDFSNISVESCLKQSRSG